MVCAQKEGDGRAYISALSPRRVPHAARTHSYDEQEC